VQRMEYDGTQPPGAPQRGPWARAAGRRGSPRRPLGRRRGRGRPCHRARQGRKTRRALAGLVLGLLMLAGCVPPPVGPRVAVLPAPGKSVEEFEADDAACRLDAAQQTGLTQPHILEQHELRNAVLGPLLGGAAGAALGAAFGAAAGNAGLGAAAGAGPVVLGTAGGRAAGYGAPGLQGAMTGPTSSAWLPRGNQVPSVPGLAPRKAGIDPSVETGNCATTGMPTRHCWARIQHRPSVCAQRDAEAQRGMATPKRLLCIPEPLSALGGIAVHVSRPHHLPPQQRRRAAERCRSVRWPIRSPPGMFRTGVTRRSISHTL
jgi:hypothetical protein